MVFPNPFTNQTTIKIKSDKNNFINPTLEIIDVLGKIVLTRNDFINNEMTINRNNIRNGLYFYKVYDSNSIIGKGRLIVE